MGASATSLTVAERRCTCRSSGLLTGLCVTTWLETRPVAASASVSRRSERPLAAVITAAAISAEIAATSLSCVRRYVTGDGIALGVWEEGAWVELKNSFGSKEASFECKSCVRSANRYIICPSTPRYTTVTTTLGLSTHTPDGPAPDEERNGASRGTASPCSLAHAASRRALS